MTLENDAQKPGAGGGRSGRQGALTVVEPQSPPATGPDPSQRAREKAKRHHKRQQQVDLERRKQIQREIVAQRRRKARRMSLRLFLFVLLPTLIVGTYYLRFASDMYESDATFMVMTASSAKSGFEDSGAGLLSQLGMRGGMNPAESMAVQDFILSRDVLQRLDQDHGLIAHYKSDAIDPVQRLEADATEEDAFDYFLNKVDVRYDPLEGFLKMSVRAADQETAHAFAAAIVRYSEEMVDGLSDRIREDQLASARRELEIAENRVRAAQARVTDIQLKRETFGVESELAIVVSVIQTLESQLADKRAQLSNLSGVVRNTNDRRLVNLRNEIASLEEQLAARRGRLTDSSSGESLAQINADFAAANLDLELAGQLFAAAVSGMEQARVQALSQTKYLAVTVRPSTPDEATHPLRYENTGLSFFIFLGAYVLISLTLATLREQISI